MKCAIQIHLPYYTVQGKQVTHCSFRGKLKNFIYFYLELNTASSLFV